jgi:phosphatidylserine decarboxylase
VTTARLPAIVRLMPRRAVSRLLGALGRAQAPLPLRLAVLGLYSRAFGADLAEADRPLRGYDTFLAFFTRGLKAPRAMPTDERTVVSPADGRVHASSPVARGAIVQAKGIDYTVAELLGDREDAAPFDGGSALTVYLAPGDYHRFHWPFDGTVTRIRHLPGDLWPVHPGAVRAVPRLFARNERVALIGHTTQGGAFAFVPVGALNVGSIRFAFHSVRTNRGATARPRTWTVHHAFHRGDECGHFEFGSAIVMLVAPSAGTLLPLEPGTRVRVGDPIGRYGA